VVAADIAYLVALAKSYRTAKIDSHQNVDIIVQAQVAARKQYM
jgi:hypothetical protein